MPDVDGRTLVAIIACLSVYWLLIYLGLNFLISGIVVAAIFLPMVYCLFGRRS